MKEVLDEILQAEKAAEEIIKEAHQRAAQLMRDADVSLNQKKAELKEAARTLIQERMQKELYVPDDSPVDSTDSKVLCGVSIGEYDLVKNRIIELVCRTFIDGEQ